MRASGVRLTTALVVLACAGLAGCGVTDEGAPVPDSSSTAVPTRPPPTAPGGTDPSDPARASGLLLLLPQQLNGFAVVGQHVVFLVAPSPTAPVADLPITITAEADDAGVTVLAPTLATTDDVAEVVVVPARGSAGATVTLTVDAAGAATTEQATVSFDVVEGEDDRAEDATRMRDLFVPWLAANRPELGITAATAWEGTTVSPQWLVVSHYLFFSEEWEMHVEWHIMVAPHDWARIDLRRRFEETAPSEAFEISSVTEGGEPHPFDVPASVWR